MRTGWALAGLLCAALVVGGCATTEPGDPSPGAPVTAATTESEGMAEAALDGDLREDDEELVISAVELREGAPEELVEITSNRPLVWTSFRDVDGNVVVELPNAVAAASVGDLSPANGLVESVRVETDRAGSRPLTRLVIATREAAESRLTAEGNLLTVELDPSTAVAAPSLAFEPLADDAPEALVAADDDFDSEEMEPAPRVAPAPEPAGAAAPMGTVDAPVRGPEPAGVRATRLAGVSVETAGDLTVVEVRGDGEFAYSTFRLSNPERFVIDLAGVIDSAGQAVTPVGSAALERVRVAQFKSSPNPVARVVLDLNDEPVPRIERTPDSLIVRLASETVPAQAAVTPASETRVARETPPPPRRDEPPVVVETTPDPADRPASRAEREQAIELTDEPSPSAGAAGSPRIEIEQAPSADPTPAARIEDSPLFDSETRIGAPAPASRTTPGGDQVFGAQSLGSEREYVGDPIDMSLRDADVVETLRSFAKISDLNIVIQPDVQGRVTVELENVPWDQALEQILQINGLGYELDGNILRIATLETLSREAENRQRLAAAQALSVPLATYMKRLSYSNAAAIATILRQSGGVLSQRGSVIVDARTNTLIIKELPEYMDTVLAIIENLDEPEPQVMIEARIIETTKRFSRQLGIEWGFEGLASAATGNSTGLVFPNNVEASGGVNLIGNTTGNGLLSLSLGNVLDTFTLDATLAAAESDGLINILSSPKVATLNNRQAVIQSGLQVPVQTIANNTVTVQFVNSTLRLEVVPQVTADGTVIMDIDIQKREVQTAFQVAGAPNAPISTKEARTQVLVRDGGTAVIGGIYEVTTDQGEERVPGLANIPIIGHLFKNRRRSDENEELLIFITPRVVRL